MARSRRQLDADLKRLEGHIVDISAWRSVNYKRAVMESKFGRAAAEHAFGVPEPAPAQAYRILYLACVNLLYLLY